MIKSKFNFSILVRRIMELANKIEIFKNPNSMGFSMFQIYGCLNLKEISYNAGAHDFMQQ